MHSRTGKDRALDALYPYARSLVLSHKRASISLLSVTVNWISTATRPVEAIQDDILSAKDCSEIRKVLDKLPDAGAWNDGCDAVIRSQQKVVLMHVSQGKQTDEIPSSLRKQAPKP